MKLVNISEVKPNPKNPRVIRDHKFEKLVNSISEFPDMLNKRPLVAFTDKDGKYVVLGGNMRLKALKELKYKEIPIILADEWTEEQKAEFLIKDNVGFGEWDFDVLANEWDEGQLTDWGLDLPVNSFYDFDEVEEDIDDEYNPKASDDDYSTFELIMLHENKLKLLEVLNSIKQNYLFEKLEEALMELIRKYENQ